MRVSVVIDSDDPDGLVAFWSAALGYQLADAPPGYHVLIPEAGQPRGPALVLQQVPEQRVGKNRLHLDIHVPDVAAHADRLEALGGRRLGEPVTELLDEHGIWWQVMADPQGNEFCVVAGGAGA